MTSLQTVIVLAFGIYSLTGFLFGLKNRKNPLGLTKLFLPLTVFVWADAVVFGLFFFLVSVFCLLTSDFILFLLIFSVFWTVRSIGETIYWFIEQFASKHLNPPSTLWPSKFYKGDEVWIVMQIFWQCVSVVGIITSVYLFSKFIQ